LAGPLLAAARSDLPPVVTTVHGPLNEDLIALYSELAGKVPVLAISETQRRAAPEVEIARVIHHGIDARNFEVGDGLGDDDGPYCLFLGRMTDDKGAHRAIEVARKAGMRILMAAKMVEPLLGPDAVFLGEVPHEMKLELLRGASALLFPIRWNEPFGLVMLEALASGTPVLAFPEGAAPEVVDNGRTGFICQDEAEMVSALENVHTINRADCRAAVEGYFSTKRMVDEHLEFFAELTASR
jgi:glycosyltransferase involved in cell wall biosynthesis